MKTFYRVFSVFILAITLSIAPLSVSPTEAAVSASDIDEQRLVVKAEILDVLREHVTFLQLVLIDRLENRVAYLQKLAEAQK